MKKQKGKPIVFNGKKTTTGDVGEQMAKKYKKPKRGKK